MIRLGPILDLIRFWQKSLKLWEVVSFVVDRRDAHFEIKVKRDATSNDIDSSGFGFSSHNLRRGWQYAQGLLYAH